MPTKSVAVLPFTNLSSSKEYEYFSDGITEEIINALAKIKGLKVTSRTSSFLFKDKSISIQEIGKQLNVATILEGSIQLAGNQVRITAKLIDVDDDFQFWSEKFDRSLDNIFEVQDEVSLTIAERLREHIGHFEVEDKLVDKKEISTETYKLYLKGRYHLMKLTLPETLKGIEIFKEVIQLEPRFPYAYLDINQGYAFLGTMGLIPSVEAFTKAQPFLEKAIQIGEQLPETQLNLSWISCWQNWNFEKAYQHLNNALAIKEADNMFLTMSNYLAVEGKFKAAHNYIDKALELDPFSAMNQHFKGFIFYLQERHEEAIPYFRKSMALKTNLPFPKLWLGLSLILLGRTAEALNFFENLTGLPSGDLTQLGGQTLAYAKIGNTEEVEKGLQALQNALQGESMGSAMNFLILTHTMTGNYSDAIQLMEQGMSYQMPLILLLKTEPIVKPLHQLPEFQSIMEKAFEKGSASSTASRKYKKTLLNDKMLKTYSQQLEKLMNEKHPYLNSNLTLRKLAKLMGIPSNQLSQLLNEGFNKNFSEYINSYRLEYFKLQANIPSNQNLTLLALAYESGFNSKTVFNTFFKKMTGKTPKAYWKEVTR